MPTRRVPASLGAALIALTTVSGAAAASASTSLVLSVSPGFQTSRLPAGVSVVERLDRVGAVLVSGPATSLPALARMAHVRGVWTDFALTTTSDSTSTDDVDGVLAPDAVGGAAGTSRAGQGVTVAVLDSGVADTAALKRSSGRLQRGPDYSGDTGSARDGFGHGTFMADLVAGGSVNGQVIGVAPAATVLDVKVAGADGSTKLSKVLRGLNWVASSGGDNGVDVVSLSLGAARPTRGYGSDPLTDAADAVQDAGIVVVVAAGNDPTQVSDPGQDPALLTVGAADTTGARAKVASFSGRGTVAGEARPDLVAAGVHVLSLVPPGSDIAQTYPDAAQGDLFRGSGTSQATAIAAGAVAVFLRGRAGLDPQDVRASFADAAGSVRGAGSGNGLLVIPTRVVAGTGAVTSEPSDGGSSPSTTSTSWSSTSWSSTSWSSTSWSSTSWSSTSWSSTSWSANGWA